MKKIVEAMFTDQQAGIRRNRSCADQNFSLRITVEQSLEWNSPFYTNSIDYEKALASIDLRLLGKILRHFEISKKFITLKQATYQDMNCSYPRRPTVFKTRNVGSH